MNPTLTSTALRLSLAAAALFALTGTAAFAQAPAAPTTTTPPGSAPAAGAVKGLSVPDKKFVHDTAKSFFYELNLSDSAKTGAKAEVTKKYTDGVNKDLYKAFEKLGEIAKAKGEVMPTELTGGDKGSAERLKKTKPDAFDKLFYREILKEAKGVERDFVTAAKSANDPEIKDFATNYLAIVKGHVTDGEKDEKEAAKAK